MKKITFIFLFAVSFFKVFGQDTVAYVTDIRNDSVYMWAPEKQFFTQGNFGEFIGNNINYPIDAKKNKIEGRVIVQFIIEKNGTVSGISILQGIGYGCDEEVSRVIALSSGLWLPGKIQGEPIRLKMIQPVFFRLP